MEDVPAQDFSQVKLERNVIPIVLKLIYDEYIMYLQSLDSML